MRKAAMAQWILSLAVDANRAAALAGDLSEEGEGRGAFWFWRSLAGVTAAMLWNSFRPGFLRLLGMASAGCLAAAGFGIVTCLVWAPGLVLWPPIPGLEFVPALGANFLAGQWLGNRTRGQELAACALSIAVGHAVNLVSERALLGSSDGLSWWAMASDICFVAGAISIRRAHLKAVR